MKKVSIYIACHKKFNLPQEKYYIPIQVGRKISNFKLDMIGDDDNGISEKNKNYCELTALYWIWKNDNQSDYVGLCHYRRYFDLSNKKIDELFKDGTDVIFTSPKYHIQSVQCTALKYVCGEDWAIFHNVLKRLYPEYEQSFIDVMTGTKSYEYNMFICSKQMFNSYCEWLFSLLFECEKYIKISNYSRAARVFGYLAEYCMYVYFLKNKCKIKTTRLLDYDGCVYKVEKESIVRKVFTKCIDISHIYKGKLKLYDSAHILGLKADNIIN